MRGHSPLSLTPFVVVAALFALAGASAQTPQRPLFRGGTMLVNVDAYPMRNGRLVEGLTSADFHVTENGVAQQVEFFEYIHIDPFANDQERRDPNTQEEGFRLIADPHRRAFVLYFDIYHLATTGARDMREPIRDFLERVIGSTDYVAALTPDVPVKHLLFGQRLETLEGALNTYWRQVYETTNGDLQAPQTAHEAFLENCYINRTPDMMANEALVKALFKLWRLDEVFIGLRDVTQLMAVLRDERTSLLLLSGGWTLVPPTDSLLRYAWGRAGADPMGQLGGQRPANGPPNKAACDAELFRLSSIDFPQRFNDLVGIAARANVTFSTIDPTGLRIYDLDMTQRTPKAQLDNPQARLEPLRTLAEATGGTAIVATNDIAAPIKRLAENAASYYLLGYYSTNTKLDGKYRKIAVSVSAPGVKVAARRGYLASMPAPPDPPSPNGAALPVPSGLTEALANLAIRQRPMGMVLDASPTVEDIAVIVELTPTSAPDWRAGGDVRVTLRRPDGAAAGSATGHLDAGSSSTMVRVPRDPVTGPWAAKVEVRGPSDSITSDINVTDDPSALVGAPLVFRRATAAAPLQPIAMRRFRRTERVHIEWSARSPLTNRLARVLDRSGKPMPIEVALTERDTIDLSTVVADVNLAPFSAGDYVIELTGDAAGRTGRSLVAIRVER